MYTRTVMTQENYAEFWGNQPIDSIWQALDPERALP
jgi:hypothetical protein